MFLREKDFQEYSFWILGHSENLLQEMISFYYLPSWKLKVRSWKLTVAIWKLKVDSWKLEVAVESQKLEVSS